MRRVLKAAAVLLAGSLAAGLGGCATPADDGAGKILTVFAAASLQGPFTSIAAAFEEQYPGIAVRLSFAGSSDLVTQLSQGAPADVFASADARNMAGLQDAGLVEGAPQDIATNILTIAVPPANPATIGSFADLANPGVKLVICASQVPCGAATKTVERETGVVLKPVSEEASVTDVLGKVSSGEADAGLVYATDVLAAGGKVKGVPFAEAGKAVNTYPITALHTSRNKDLAAAFIAAVTGPDGRKILTDAGFGTPGP
ncbi:molybdate transport system substrate-binding protein [Arthrobacter sp. V4I6]|uniref:molybdate ABC transporter substrate-binding protein n=1 Tax=unclassified Arthrobacter TaxID=235627 RepID=UPI0027845952|nr:MULTISPECIES: molybdate ABC transporter substrate-binding protein [unclassified Arthrobacter]MDQ0819310.1 molybdate transport system substrate-binding protein [Arthrobacter sp. V1I7]MDQ0853493.1 molybdate transport system substrate-binding protein [Arthrobacter sp. V4I6]